LRSAFDAQSDLGRQHGTPQNYGTAHQHRRRDGFVDQHNLRAFPQIALQYFIAVDPRILARRYFEYKKFCRQTATV
jgi:hypothetical protein